jgi:hypothetical protein
VVELTQNQNSSNQYSSKTVPTPALLCPFALGLRGQERVYFTFFKDWLPVLGSLRGPFLAWPCYLCDCLFIYLPSNMIYSFWHKSPKKMQFQHSLSWCEKMLTQPKKWLVVSPGRELGFVSTGSSDEGRRRKRKGLMRVSYPGIWSQGSTCFDLQSSSFPLLPFPSYRWSTYGKLISLHFVSTSDKRIASNMESRNSSFSIW